MRKLCLAIFSICLVLVSSAFVGFKNNDKTNIIQGNVVYVYDGDTVKLKTNDDKEYKIRLSGIDAPEYNQKYGKEAKEYLSSLIYNKLICIEVLGTDKYDRILATIFYEKENVNCKMLKAGYAWHYKYYDSNKGYAEAEMYAKNKKVGLWQDKAPEAPWDYRHSKKHVH